MSSYPSTITATFVNKTEASQQWSHTTYQHHAASDAGTLRVYRRYSSTGTDYGDAIAVNTSTDEWVDGSATDSPVAPITSTIGGVDYVTLYSGSATIGNLLFEFAKPVIGGGSSFLSTSTVRTLTQNGNLLVAFVGGGNASVSNLSIIDVDGNVPSNPGVSVWHTHTNGTDTTFTWPISEPGEYRLMNLQSQFAIITVTSISKKKKVYCNFW